MEFYTVYRKSIAPLLLAALLGVFLLGSSSSHGQSGARTHTVQAGDTLSAIAGEYLGDAALWRVLWQANPQVRDPRLLQVGQVLTLPSAGTVARSGVARRSAKRRGGVVKLEPRIYSTPIEPEVITIPRDAIAPFVDRPRVLGAGEINASPYIVGQTAGRLTGGSGDHIFVRGLSVEAIPRYGIFREGGPLRDIADSTVWSEPGSAPVWAKGSVLGYEGILVGEAEVVTFHPDGQSTLRVVTAHQEILNGDLILPLQERTISLDYVPRDPAQPVSGSVIKVPAGTTQAGQFDLVALSVGSADGIQQSDLLDVFQAATTAYDQRLRRNVTLPLERVGVLMVLTTYEQVSFAIVLEANRAIHIADKVTEPGRDMNANAVLEAGAANNTMGGQVPAAI